MSPTPPTARVGTPFHGWRIVAVAFLVDFIAVGFFFYSYGVFFKAVAGDFGGSRLGVAVGISLTNLVGPVQVPIHAAGIPLAGWIFDATGSYDLAFDLFLGTYVVAGLLVGLMRLKRT